MLFLYNNILNTALTNMKYIPIMNSHLKMFAAQQDIECKIIKNQIERRCKYRNEFLKLRTDPCKHSQEAGYVFDEAVQRFLTLKAYQTYYFKPSLHSAMFGTLTILPIFVYGYLLWNHRTNFEEDCRCGKLKYRDRMFKFQ